jgi:hypothetical protein
MVMSFWGTDIARPFSRKLETGFIDMPRDGEWMIRNCPKQANENENAGPTSVPAMPSGEQYRGLTPRRVQRAA